MILGLFDFEDDAVKAIERLKEAGFRDLHTLTPVSSEEIESALGKRRPYVGRYTLVGALIGAAVGFSLPTLTSIINPQPQGGMPVVPLPPYGLVALETSVLFALIFTFVGFFLVTKLLNHDTQFFPEEIGGDTFAVVLAGKDGRLSEARKILEDCGAVSTEEHEVPTDE